MDDQEDVNRLCRRVYFGAQDVAVDRADAFDLAGLVLASWPGDQDATELASMSIDYTRADWSRMAELALALLAAIRFEPAFPQEPGWLLGLEDAMRLVNHDLAASGLSQGCRLRFREWGDGLGGTVYAQSWAGDAGTGSGIPADAGADPVSAVVAVADDAQDAVVHTIWSAWPLCPVHRFGVHVREHDGAGVWWCTGDGGHVAAAVGRWAGP
ncbi:hypothetical protein [Actinoplanes sp. CA-252034]|uniref:hypothetical protein n=1 Tax=Actinoplanes sp. CA-252034 TaxID=3239906 RepID=UPI003D9A025E